MPSFIQDIENGTFLKQVLFKGGTLVGIFFILLAIVYALAPANATQTLVVIGLIGYGIYRIFENPIKKAEADAEAAADKIIAKLGGTNGTITAASPSTSTSHTVNINLVNPAGSATPAPGNESLTGGASDAGVSTITGSGSTGPTLTGSGPTDRIGGGAAA